MVLSLAVAGQSIATSIAAPGSAAVNLDGDFVDL